MTDKSTFTPEEWQQIVDCVSVVVCAVLFADSRTSLRGQIKAFKEVTLREADAGGNLLIAAVLADQHKSGGLRKSLDSGRHVWKLFDSRQTNGYEKRAKAIAFLGEVSDLLERKAPRDAAGYKVWIVGIGKRIAVASRARGFIWRGDWELSGATMAALMEICRALNVPVPRLQDLRSTS
jgi:hypothetical protein